MFQFPGCPSVRLWIHLTMTGHYSSRVSPFGYLRINACLRLLVAFRSLPRPSSAYGALASTLRSCSLDFLVALWYQSLGILILRPIVLSLIRFHFTCVLCYHLATGLFFLSPCQFALALCVQLSRCCQAVPGPFSCGMLSLSTTLLPGGGGGALQEPCQGCPKTRFAANLRHGGSQWTRTTDLTLIRRVL